MSYILTATEGRVLCLTHKGPAFVEDDRLDPVTFTKPQAHAEAKRLSVVYPSLKITVQRFRP
jgi:hypothetical protein